MNMLLYILAASLSWTLIVLENFQLLPISYSLWVIATIYCWKNREQTSFHSVMFVSVLVRALYIFLPDVLTGDLPRYLWEGHLVRSGINPYQYAPNSHFLINFKNDAWNSIEYKHLSAIYPPVAQYALALFAWSAKSWKCFLFMIELLNLYLIKKLLDKHSIKKINISFYALLPLPIIEIVGAGHLEGLLVTFFLLALTTRSPIVRGIIYSAGALVKYVLGLPLMFTGFYLLYTRKWKELFIMSGAFFAASVILTLPFLDAELSIITSLKEYILYWRFNDSLLYLIGEFFSVDWQDNRTFDWIRKLLSIIWLASLGVLLYRKKDIATCAAYGFAFFLLTSSVVHPWYGLWFAPLLTILPSKALLTFALTLPFSYFSRFGGIDSVPDAVLLLEYVPVYILLLYELFATSTSSESQQCAADKTPLD